MYQYLRGMVNTSFMLKKCCLMAWVVFILHLSSLRISLRKKVCLITSIKENTFSTFFSIGVITSLTGAVIRDIINVLSRRFENFNLMLYPVSVQGVQAASTISRAIKRLNQLNCVDVIILARGGGSLEELWAFNEEQVARSIFESKIP